MHPRAQVRSLPQVFNPDERPWIAIDAAHADDVAATIAACPTGALHFRRLDGGPEGTGPGETTVDPQPNGPLFVRGHIRVVNDDGDAIPARTGASRSHPRARDYPQPR